MTSGSKRYTRSILAIITYNCSTIPALFATKETGRILITVQNHGFCVDASTLPSEVRLIHVNLNNKSLEGMKSKEHRFFSVQFHPESGPGPHDALNLFTRLQCPFQCRSFRTGSNPVCHP
ncbi:MAG: hypothetical protein V2A65_01900 [Candidatus Omnitrophota bacterium]